MAIPQDKPNPVPPWAAALRAGTAVPASGGLPEGQPLQAQPSPEYSIAVAAYIHRAMADTMMAFAETVAAMGDRAEPRTAVVDAARAVAHKHQQAAAVMEEQTR